jgi:hypothetical protein
MAVNLETKRKPHPMDVYFMKVEQDKEDRKKIATQPPPSMSFTGFMVSNFDGYQDVPAVNPTLNYRMKESKSGKRNSKAEVANMVGPPRMFEMTNKRTMPIQSKASTRIEHSRPRTAIQRVTLKLEQLRQSNSLMSELRMRVESIKAQKPAFNSERLEANLNVAATMERSKDFLVQQNQKRKSRTAAIVEAARNSECLQLQLQQELDAKQEFRSKAKERFLKNQAELNHKSRQMLFLTFFALVSRSWWWLALGNEHRLLIKRWRQVMKASMVLKKCAKIFLWKVFLKKKASARNRLMMWLPDRAKRWVTNRYNSAVHVLIVSIKEWLRCNRYKILASKYLSRMFRIQATIRFAQLRRYARAECNWMLLQNHLNSLKCEIACDEQQSLKVDEHKEDQQLNSKRLRWLVEAGDFGNICKALGPENCLAAIMSYLSSSCKAYIKSIDDWKDVCVKKRKLGFKWMPPMPTYKFLMTHKQLEHAVMKQAHDLLHKGMINESLEKNGNQSRQKRCAIAKK